MAVDVEDGGTRLLLIRIANKLGRPFGVNPFPRAFANSMTAGITDRSEVFDRIYTSNFWGSAESRSGIGSERGTAVRYLKRLRVFLREGALRRVFDAPCGHLSWTVDLIGDPEVSYVGGDISPTLIGELKARFPDVELRLFDICRDIFPTADVWHCRDCLFHLPFHDVRAALERFVASDIPYALLTTHKARLLHRNLDVPAGGFRFLDLERPPVSLPPAEHYIPDYKKGSDFPRYVALWTRESVADALSRWRA